MARRKCLYGFDEDGYQVNLVQWPQRDGKVILKNGSRCLTQNNILHRLKTKGPCDWLDIKWGDRHHSYGKWERILEAMEKSGKIKYENGKYYIVEKTEK